MGVVSTAALLLRGVYWGLDLETPKHVDHGLRPKTPRALEVCLNKEAL